MNCTLKQINLEDQTMSDSNYLAMIAAAMLGAIGGMVFVSYNSIPKHEIEECSVMVTDGRGHTRNVATYKISYFNDKATSFTCVK